MKFAYPWLLLFYFPFIGLLIYAVKRRKPSLVVPSVKPFNDSNPDKRLNFLSDLPFLLYALSIAFLIFALARPQKGIEELKQRAEGIDIMLAIDLSGSMQAIDIPENYTTTKQVQQGLESGKLRTRIDIAKEEIQKFIEKRPNDRIGLIAFAPLPYVACPPTLDHTWLSSHLDSLKSGIIGDSTGIAGPIASAVHRLKNSDSKRRALVLFTDGRNNVDAKITPLQAAKLAKTFDVVIYTVGIGSKNAYVIQDGFFGSQLIPIGQEFDREVLQNIAETSGGKYYAAADAEGLEKTMNEINEFEKTTMEQPRYIDYKELAPSIIKLSIVMLLAAFGLSNTLLLRIP